MWQNGDPQFSSAGMLMSVNSDFGSTLCEYTGSDIRSSGLTYADLDYSYVSDDGAFEYTMRHVEMPQADENRTYYRIYVRFLKDVTYEKGSFSLASFNGRNCTYKYSSYLDENGKEKQINRSQRAENYMCRPGRKNTEPFCLLCKYLRCAGRLFSKE